MILVFKILLAASLTRLRILTGRPRLERLEDFPYGIDFRELPRSGLGDPHDRLDLDGNLTWK